MATTEYDNLCRQRKFAKGDNVKKWEAGFDKIKWKTDEEREQEQEATVEEQCTNSEKNTKD